MKRWTEEEEQLLEQHYNISDKEQLKVLFPDRDYISIMKKASKLGINDKKTRWTDGEIEKLKRLYPITPMDILLKELKGKTESAIQSKAKLLKLKKSEEYGRIRRNKGRRPDCWTPYEDSILKLHYPYGGYKKVMEELPLRTSHGIRNRANLLGIKFDPTIHPIWERKQEIIEDIGINRVIKVTFTKL
jgi:hypothetical protein